MSERPTAATPKEMIAVGGVACALGLYFTLIGAGVLPEPGGPDNLHAPLWIATCAGLVFLLGGGAAVLQGLGRANAAGELPGDAPDWIRVMQYLLGVALFALFAIIGSWIAFGAGTRAFSGSFMGFNAQIGAAVGRAIFGIGAVVTWLCTIGFAVSGARKLLSRGKR